MSHEGKEGEKQAVQALMFPMAPRALNNCRDASLPASPWPIIRVLKQPWNLTQDGSKFQGHR